MFIAVQPKARKFELFLHNTCPQTFYSLANWSDMEQEMSTCEE